MPRNRQATAEREALVRTLGLRFPAGQVLPSHTHAWGQLVHATEGVMCVSTEGGSWVVPPQRAVWIPARFEHAIRMAGAVRMRTLYVRPDLTTGLRPSCTVIGVSALLRELVLEILRVGRLEEDVPEHARLAAVLVDQLRATPVVPLSVRHPADARARRVAERARERLAEPATLTDLARGSGASPRTIERLFQRETGQSFGRWLQQVKVMRALELLAAGSSVTAAGLDVGYESTSAFIAMFRRVTGSTPGRYYE